MSSGGKTEQEKETLNDNHSSVTTAKKNIFNKSMLLHILVNLLKHESRLNIFEREPFN